jgi:hypothetical protein
MFEARGQHTLRTMFEHPEGGLEEGTAHVLLDAVIGALQIGYLDVEKWSGHAAILPRRGVSACRR